jgi:hypothetical protein
MEERIIYSFRILIVIKNKNKDLKKKISFLTDYVSIGVEL